MMMFSENLRMSGSLHINETNSKMCIIIDGSNVGVFWMCSDKTVVEEGQFRNGYKIGNASYELSERDAEEMLNHLLKVSA